jgi:hypothetical protein
MGSTTTPWDRSIFFENLVLPLKGELMKNVYGGTITHRNYNRSASSLKKNAGLAGWATPGDRLQI